MKTPGKEYTRREFLKTSLAGERIGRRELAELGHGGLCLHCPECRYPVCPFGK